MNIYLSIKSKQIHFKVILLILTLISASVALYFSTAKRVMNNDRGSVLGQILGSCSCQKRCIMPSCGCFTGNEEVCSWYTCGEGECPSCSGSGWQLNCNFYGFTCGNVGEIAACEGSPNCATDNPACGHCCGDPGVPHGLDPDLCDDYPGTIGVEYDSNCNGCGNPARCIKCIEPEITETPVPTVTEPEICKKKPACEEDEYSNQEKIDLYCNHFLPTISPAPGHWEIPTWCITEEIGDGACKDISYGDEYLDEGDDKCKPSKCTCTWITGTPTPTIIPVCNNNFTLNSSDSCNTFTLSTTGLPDTHQLVSVDYNPTSYINNCNTTTYPPPNFTQTCSVTGAGSTIITYNWQDCYPPGSGNCISCNKTLTVNPSFIPTPNCNSVSLIIEPSPFTLGSNVDFVVDDDSAAGYNHVTEDDQYTGFTPTVSPTLRPSFSTPDSQIATSYIDEPVSPPINWTHMYSIVHGTCPDLKVNNCTKSTASDIAPPPGFLTTNGGDVYIIDNDQSGFPTDGSKHLSQYLFSTLAQNSAQMVPSSDLLYSTYSYLLFDYIDNNSFPVLPRTFYQKIRPILFANPNSSIQPDAGGNWSGVIAPKSNKNIIDVSGDLTITSDTWCGGAAIILVAGDLTINPNFKILSDPVTHGLNNGCLFIVAGTTTIAGGTVKPDVSIPDLVEAFIITENIIVPRDDDDRLLVVGAILTRNNTDFSSNKPGFGRNINTNLNPGPNYTYASEHIEFEGARYVKLFGNLLTQPVYFKIREINTLEYQ